MIQSIIDLIIGDFVKHKERKLREIISGIYCIENKINGKKYIGQSINCYKRIMTHKRHLSQSIDNSSVLQRAFNKYKNLNDFEFYIVEKCEIEILNERESYYIKEWNTKVRNGYNMTDGGEGSRGYVPTEETKRKISLATKGRKMSEQTRENMSKGANKGANKGENNHFFGKHHTEDSKNKKREYQLNRKMTGSSSKYISVFFDKNRPNNPWMVALVLPNKIRKNLGRYNDEIKAAKVYDDFIIKNNLYEYSLNFNLTLKSFIFNIRKFLFRKRLKNKNITMYKEEKQ